MHTLAYMITNEQHYSPHRVLVWPLAGSPQRRGIDKLANSNWAITTPCAGIDSAVLGAGR